MVSLINIFAANKGDVGTIVEILEEGDDDWTGYPYKVRWDDGRADIKFLFSELKISELKKVVD